MSFLFLSNENHKEPKSSPPPLSPPLSLIPPLPSLLSHALLSLHCQCAFSMSVSITSRVSLSRWKIPFSAIHTPKSEAMSLYFRDINNLFQSMGFTTKCFILYSTFPFLHYHSLSGRENFQVNLPLQIKLNVLEACFRRSKLPIGEIQPKIIRDTTVDVGVPRGPIHTNEDPACKSFSPWHHQ